MLKLGIIGCGRIVEEAHAPALASLADRASVVALADPSGERREAVARALDAPVAQYGTWSDMLANAAFDAVVVAVPHHLHLAAITDAAAAGLDVICEKPLANTLDEVDAAIEAVEAAGVRLSVMHNWMFNPDAQAALRAIERGRIGTPFLVRNESIWGVPWTSRDPNGNWRLRASLSGGGIVIDSAYHAIYVAEAAMGQPIVRVFASLQSRGGESVEDTAVIILEHLGGGTTTIQRSWVAKGGGAGAHEIHGSTGSLRFRQADPLVTNLIMAGQPPPPADGPVAPALEIFDNDIGSWESLHPDAGPWWTGIRVIFSETFDAWAAGRDAPAGAAAARRVIEVVTAIYASAEEGQAIGLDATGVGKS